MSMHKIKLHSTWRLKTEHVLQMDSSYNIGDVQADGSTDSYGEA